MQYGWDFLYVAKDLPYFKFFVSEWSNGNITLCSYEAQGLFTNLCSLYWSQSGAVKLADAKRRHSGCSAVAWKELISEKIIKISDGNILISFLDEQFAERKELSKKNSQNALERYKKTATALPTHSNGTATAHNKEERREEKRKEEEKREEDSLHLLGIDICVDKLLKDEYWHHSINHLTKGKDLGGAIRSSFAHIECQPSRFATATLNDLKKVTLSWLENKKPVTPDLKAISQKDRLKNI